MVCVSKGYSWFAKGWELLSERFGSLKGKLAIQKEFENCTHVYIYSHFGESSRRMLFGGRTWRAQLCSPLVQLQGGTWLQAKNSTQKRRNKSTGGGDAEDQQRSEIEWRNQRAVTKKGEILPFVESGVVQTWCRSGIETNTKCAFDLAKSELIFGRQWWIL